MACFGSARADPKLAQAGLVFRVRIVLNTRSESAGAQASIVALAHRLREAGVDATLNDWERYDRYDVAIFLGYDHAMGEARAASPGIRVGLSDPKQSRQEWIEAAREADFLLVSSVEQREAFLRLNRNVHVLFMFPLVTGSAARARAARHVRRGLPRQPRAPRGDGGHRRAPGAGGARPSP